MRWYVDPLNKQQQNTEQGAISEYPLIYLLIAFFS